MSLFVENYIVLLEKNANEETALWASKYLKNLHTFFGIKAPLRRQLQRQYLSENPVKTFEEAELIIKELWNCKQRELHYFAMDLAVKFMKKAPKNAIDLYEYLITEKSWWDTVDLIAVQCVGSYFKQYPDEIIPKIEQYMASENMWLQRTALLFQLKYKKETNTELMFELIRMLASSKEFFIRKAIGWVLREYSKTNALAVREFLQTIQLSGLSVREASKYL